MTNTDLTHERSPLFDDAVHLYDVVEELATTRRRMINELLMAHVVRLLHHAGCAVNEKKGPALDCRLHYTQLAVTKLATVVEAARRSALITEEQSQRARALMLSMEEKLAPAPPSTGQAEAVQANDGQDSVVEEAPPDGLAEDALADLRQLVARDSRPKPLDGGDAESWPPHPPALSDAPATPPRKRCRATAAGRLKRRGRARRT